MMKLTVLNKLVNQKKAMTTVTESDIKEIKTLIRSLEQRLTTEIIEIKAEVKNTNVKVDALGHLIANSFISQTTSFH